MQEAAFKGAGGRTYRMTALRPSGPFPQGPAVYCFARPGPGGAGWTALFLSRTANIATRMEGHERWAEAELLGATHVLLLSFAERADREAAEADLLASLRPIMNDGAGALPEDIPVRHGEVVRFFQPVRVGERGDAAAA